MLHPILDRVLVKRIKEEKDSLIHTPDAFVAPSVKGEVMAIGQFFYLSGQRIPVSEILSIGDIVRFSEYTAEELGDDLVLTRVQDIRGIYREEACNELNETSALKSSSSESPKQVV